MLLSFKFCIDTVTGMKIIVVGLIAPLLAFALATPLNKGHNSVQSYDFEEAQQIADFGSAEDGSENEVAGKLEVKKPDVPALAPARKDSKASVDLSQSQADPQPDGSDTGRTSWPRWPHDFRWSHAGACHGMGNLQVIEPADPHTWTDNYFCYAYGPGWIHPGLVWAFAGPIHGMRCTQILEPADPHTWSDNYLCVPLCSPYRFKWSFAGPIGGLDCIQWLETADPHTWSDNYLCM